MDNDLKSRLLKPRLEETDVEVPGIGTVRIRALSRAEVLAARKAADNDLEKVDGPRILVLERKMLALAMVDPPMTEAEIGEWQKVSNAGELDVVTRKVQEISGLMEGAGKSDVQSV